MKIFRENPPKKLFLILVILAVLFTNACTKKTDEKAESSAASIQGYVIKVENQKILIVDAKSHPTGNLKEFYDACWVSNINDSVEVGQLVQVLFKGTVQTSYPGLATADKLSVLSTEQPPGAKLSEEEVICQVLLNQEITNLRVPVIKEINFNPNTDIWTLQVSDGAKVFSGNEPQKYILQIPDS